MAAKRTLDLPSLTVAAPIVFSTHLSSVFRQRPFTRSLGILASRDYGRTDPELVTTELVVVFGVVALITQQATDRLVGDRLRDGRGELWRVDARPEAHVGAQPEVRLQIADSRELRVGNSLDADALAPLEVTADVPGL